MKVQKAILAGGCFWCIEALFERLPGVIDVESGYSGGHVDNPGYEAVCTGATGHAEAVRISFDAEVISYKEILEHFWKFHDPTTLNRQGADVGNQYRSSIFYLDFEQEKIARLSLAEAVHSFDAPIVTLIEKAGSFWPAENYHQDYYRHNSDAPYCRFAITPKLKAQGFIRA
jgi:peptide-methionine (S)-S-oxide reductase